MPWQSQSTYDIMESLFKPLAHAAIGTPFKTESDEIDTPFKTKHPENHTLSGRSSPLRSHKGVPPPPGVMLMFVAYVRKVLMSKLENFMPNCMKR